MTHLTRDIFGETATAVPEGVDVAARPRIDGFSARIEADVPFDELRRSLVEITDRCAFHLEALFAEAAGPAAAPVASAAAGYRATFGLCAANGTTGDAQIFALLREIARHHRWTAVDKRTVRSRADQPVPN